MEVNGNRASFGEFRSVPFWDYPPKMGLSGTAIPHFGPNRALARKSHGIMKL